MYCVFVFLVEIMLFIMMEISILRNSRINGICVWFIVIRVLKYKIIGDDFRKGI